MGAGAGPSTAWSNAFAIVAESNEAFAEAVLKKLVIEITSAEVRKNATRGDVESLETRS
jgi:hypothetical protein